MERTVVLITGGEGVWLDGALSLSLSRTCADLDGIPMHNWKSVERKDAAMKICILNRGMPYEGREVKKRGPGNQAYLCKHKVSLELNEKRLLNSRAVVWSPNIASKRRVRHWSRRGLLQWPPRPDIYHDRAFPTQILSRPAFVQGVAVNEAEKAQVAELE